MNSKRRLSSIVWNQIKFSLKWFCDHTTLHGFKYISNKNSSTLTRLFFGFLSFSSALFCSYLITLHIVEYNKRSTITTITSNAYPVWKVPFPSVTICNFNVVYKDNIKILMNTAKVHEINQEIFTDFIYDSKYLLTVDELQNVTKYRQVYTVLHYNGYYVDEMMKQLAHPCDSMIKKCYWQSKKTPCSDMFQSVKTTQGYCCAFNYAGASEFGYARNNEHSSMPYKYVGGAGPALGLRIVLDVEASQYASPIKTAYGFNVLVQDFKDYAEMELMGSSLHASEELTISTTPVVYRSSENIRDLDPRKRQCLFRNEGQLTWSTHYSFHTCLNECKERIIYKYCNCLPFYYPTKISDKSRLCTLLDMDCIRSNRHRYRSLQLSEFISDSSDIDHVGEIVNNKCICYPQCHMRTYDLHLDRGRAFTKENNNLSILNVYFNTVGCIRTDMDTYYTWDHVLASIGGIFGLCLGGSLITILECCYFLCKCVAFTKSATGNKKSPTSVSYIQEFKHR